MKTSTQLYLFFFLAGFWFPADAQEKQVQDTIRRGSIYPGFIITQKGDTMRGFLLNINLWMNQHMTFYYKDSTDFKGRIQYKPSEIKAYQVGNRYYESMNYTFSFSSHRQNFILRKVHGPIDLFVWYYDEDRAKLTSPDITIGELSAAFIFNEDELWTNEFGIKDHGVFTEFTAVKFLMKFAKNMSAYIADDAELAQKVKDKTKGYQGTSCDIENIVMEYNKWKTENK
jgi:hypothetical protein